MGRETHQELHPTAAGLRFTDHSVSAGGRLGQETGLGMRERLQQVKYMAHQVVRKFHI